MKRLLLFLALCASCFGQGLGVITSTRAIDWTKAGLAATVTYGSGGSACDGAHANCVETTTNPWTPPTRVQCGATLNASGLSNGTDLTAINAAIAGCLPGSYVLLAAGNWHIQTLTNCDGGTDACVLMRTNGVSLRGSGPMGTILNLAGNSTNFQYSVCCNSAQNASLSLSSYSVGTNSVTITGATCGAACSNLAVGQMAFLIECDQGNTGAPPYGGFASTCDGPYVDPYPSGQSAVWQCGRDIGVCNQNDFSIKGFADTQNAATGGCAANCVTMHVGGTPNFVTGSAWNNVPILINGVRFIISSVQSTTVLTLATAPGTQTNVPYLFNQSIHAYNQQNVTVTSFTNNGGGSYTIGFTPGLYSADWSSTRNAIMWWSNASDTSLGMGLEDMTIHMVQSGANQIHFGGTCDSWIKGVRLIVGSVNTALSISRGCHNLEANNYIAASDPATLISNISEAITIGDATTSGGMSDNLFINNIITDTLTYWGEGNDAGNVSAYNHSRNAQQPDYQTVMLDHFAGQIFELNEGNFLGRYQVDITHGTPSLGTLFRSYVNGDDPPFYTQNPGTTQYTAYARFFNILGSALGGNRSTAYSGTSFSQGFIYAIQNDSDNAGNVDPLVPSGFYRWGNCDVITAGCKFDVTEVPGTLTGNAASYSQTSPGANHNLPCSFFIAAFTNTNATPCVPKMSGGTGLSWWKVCTSFSSFPTCTGTTTQPFPPVGPELGAGPFVNGFAYDNPAGIAFKTLPIDTTFQSSFTVVSSAWSNVGTTCSVAGAGGAPAPYTPCMVLTVTLTSIGGNLSAEHIMGGFQLVGAAAGCYPSSGISFTGRSDNEIWMTSSSTTKIVYALAADPGANACGNNSTITLKYPDVRQFDEKIFQTDTGGNPPPAPARTMFASGRAAITGEGIAR